MMNKQDWKDYKDYLKSLLVPIKETAHVTREQFVHIVNNKNIKRELYSLRFK